MRTFCSSYPNRWRRIQMFRLVIALGAGISIFLQLSGVGVSTSQLFGTLPAFSNHPSIYDSTLNTNARTAAATPPLPTTTTTEKSYLSSYQQDDLLVQQGDDIYTSGPWDASPVVLEEFKLVFFTTAKVGCTVWKMLFRRMMGLPNWKAVNTADNLPWNPVRNGLKYLYNYNRTYASFLMTDPEWTRAIIVRDPKERLLSAYLDKGKNFPYIKRRCCRSSGNCTAQASQSLQGFFELIQTCNDSHWSPQYLRMEAKYWPYINFVGHMDTVAEDSETLLKRIGAWERFGKTGWGKNGNSSAFGTTAGDSSGRKHATNAKDKLLTYFTTPEFERQVEQHYRGDYQNPIMNITKTVIHSSNNSNPSDDTRPHKL